MANLLRLYTSGIGLVFRPDVLLFTFAGTFLGIVLGALPGLTAVMGVAILIPLTYGLSAEVALMALLGVYCGAVYGGSISATLLSIPGTPAAVMTTMDAHPMAKKGEAGRALGLATVCSFIGGALSAIALSVSAPLIANFALKFTSIELFSIAIFGLSIMAYVSPGSSVLKAFVSGAFGLLIATVGLDPMSAYPRFTFGRPELITGVEFISAMIGLFGLGEALSQVEARTVVAEVQTALGRIIPRWDDMKRIIGTMLRSTVIGTIIGAIPGTGATIASIVSYGQEKRISKHPERFGTGCPEGIAASETANNACTGGAMIPLLSLGIPGDSVTALLVGAFMIHGLRPGPLLFTERPDLVSAIFLGMLLANVFMLILGLGGARLFAMILKIPKDLLNTLVIALCFVGSYAIRNSVFDMEVMLAFGALGYAFRKAGIPDAPLVLALILGPTMESNLRRTLALCDGNIVTFLQAFTQHPIAGVTILATVALLLSPLIISRRSRAPQQMRAEDRISSKG